jgi:hypothetical protein
MRLTLVQWPDIKRSHRKIMGLRSRNRLMAGVPKRVTPVTTWYDLMHGGQERSIIGREFRVYRHNGKNCFFRHVYDDQDVVLEFMESDFEDDEYLPVRLTRTFYEKPNGFKEVRLIKTGDGEFESREYPIKLERILDVY